MCASLCGVIPAPRQYIMLAIVAGVGVTISAHQEGSVNSTKNSETRIDRRSFLGYTTLASGLFAAETRLVWCAPKVDSASSIVTTTSGKIRGAMQDRVHAFKGIPYGASTEGAGRFLPPTTLQP